MSRTLRLAALLLAPLCGPATLHAVPAAPGASRIQDDSAPSPLVAFVEALGDVRAERPGAVAALRDASLRVADELGRTDALEIAAYYASLPASAHRPSLAAEARLDELRAALAALDESDGNEPGRRAALWTALESLAADSEKLVDVVPHAHVASLLSRLLTRDLEEDLSRAPGNRDVAARARALAEEALARFRRAGMTTPTLEPLWTLARLALLEGDLLEAERMFLELERRAKLSGRVIWEERALLGLVGVHRDRGAPHAAGLTLARLARTRDPRSCWALAREIAVQRLLGDDAAGALRWLERHPPSVDDIEIVLEEAEAERDALVVAARLRAGDLEQLDPGAAPVPDLLRAALLLELDDPAAALELLDTTGSDGNIDRACLRGRALRTLGRTREAALVLRQALDAAVTRGEHAGATRGDASAVGEWLGLSAVLDLALCHVELDDPVGAAAVIEASHARVTVEAARARVLEAASGTDLGLVTWLVGADRTLRVHVKRTGDASVDVLPRGRRAMERAVARARSTVRDADDARTLSRDLGPLADALLPEAVRRGAEGASLLLLPHGPLERAPLEALPDGAGAPLGTELALRIAPALPSESGRAPSVDLRLVRWRGYGAPARTSFAELDAARDELEALDELSPRFDARTGAAFTADALADALAGSDAVHVATHVVRDEISDALSPQALLASGDERVDAARLGAIAPRLPLLALVACGSADGARVDGLAVRGLAQLCLESGTREALVTQWPIDDRAASRASLAFHGALRAGADSAEAARRARRLLAGLGEAPREWAAYRLLGTP